uniref:CCHC-type domain-containing protein n=1 Tax=Trichuris muris TaxID=70415 RepID=A0A5S6QGX1_TRIMR
MNSMSRQGQRRRRGRLSQDGLHPDAATDISQSAERDDSRVDVVNLADAVASLTRQVADLQVVVKALKPHPEAPASLKTSPEDIVRTCELEDTAKPGRDRTVQDTLWFEEPTNSSQGVGGTPVIPQPWMQQISTASQMDVFDGDPRKWPTFIANFRSLIHETVQSDAQRLAILGQMLSPKLRSGFSGLIANPAMYRELLQRLHKLYGDPKTLAKTNLNDLMSLPPLRSEQCCDLETFFCKVSGPVSTMKLCGLIHDLKSSALLEHTASKLTPRLQERWLSYKRVLPTVTTLETFVEWLQTVLSEKMLTAWTSATGTVTPTTRERKRHTVRTTAVSGSAVNECCICRNGKHLTDRCSRFLDMNLRNRAKEVFRHGLCLQCLRQGHRQRDCTVARRCDTDDCQSYHHRLMHDAPRLIDVRVKGVRTAKSPMCERETERVDVGLASSQNPSEIVCAVVPVIAHANGRSVTTFALLDSGSEISLLSKRLALQMKVKGSPQRSPGITPTTTDSNRRNLCRSATSKL